MFKESFKYYKSRKPAPNFEEVLDFHGNSPHIKEKTKQLSIVKHKEATPLLIDTCKWEVYEILDHPGFLYIKNPFTPLGQRYWIQQSIQEYTKKPNKLNIDEHALIPSTSNWWEYAHQKHGHKAMLKKLRWSTIGYHHNWNTKIYSEASKTEFPKNLNVLAKHFADALGFLNFNAEAAIVNFYHLDSTLSGHTDHSEEFLDAPLFSFSFGNSAIFLLGGHTLDEKPVAVFIHSGDVVVMSKESRLCYHAVPKIVQTKHPVWNDLQIRDAEMDEVDFRDCIDDDMFQPFREYLEYSRINLNVRQVLKCGQTVLEAK